MQESTNRFGVLPFSLGHLCLMTVRERERKILEMLGTPEILMSLKTRTVVEYGGDDFIKILGVVGMRIAWPGVAEVFLIPREDLSNALGCPGLARRRILGFVRQVKNVMQVAREEYGIRRFQTVAVDDELHNKWLTFMGFEQEGLMKEYSTDGEDYKLWALRQLY